MALSEPEKDFLVEAVRTADESARIALYRNFKLDGHEMQDGAVKRRVAELMDREDAKAFMRREQAIMAQARSKRAAELDALRTENALNRERLETAAIQLLLQLVDHEQAALEADPKRGAASGTRLHKSIREECGRAVAGESLSPEEQAAIAESYKRKLAVQAAPSPAPPKDLSAPVVTIRDRQPIILDLNLNRDKQEPKA